MARDPKDEPSLIDNAREELASMLREGKDHPSTVPIFAGAAIGAVAGVVLPVISWPIGLAAGAGIAFYNRIRK